MMQVPSRFHTQVYEQAGISKMFFRQVSSLIPRTFFSQILLRFSRHCTGITQVLPWFLRRFLTQVPQACRFFRSLDE